VKDKAFNEEFLKATENLFKADTQFKGKSPTVLLSNKLFLISRRIYTQAP
jgi:hypothetical protein